MYPVIFRGIGSIDLTGDNIVAKLWLNMKFDEQIVRRTLAFDTSVGGVFNFTS
jgi:hypothetical protein